MTGIFRTLARRRDQKRLDRFFARYTRRILIVHQGLTLDWLEELLKIGGGGGYFRIDARQPLDEQSPVSWLTHRFILPLNIPLPLLCDVGTDRLTVRHLRSRGYLCHPADIGWILDDMRNKARFHATLHREPAQLISQHGLAVEDNAYEIDFGS